MPLWVVALAKDEATMAVAMAKVEAVAMAEMEAEVEFHHLRSLEAHCRKHMRWSSAQPDTAAYGSQCKKANFPHHTFSLDFRNKKNGLVMKILSFTQ